MKSNTKREIQISVWVSAEESEKIKNQAKNLGLSVSGFLKMLTYQEAQRQQLKNLEAMNNGN